MNIQNCHFCKGCHVRCHTNWVQDFHLMLYLDSHFGWIMKKMTTGILWNFQVYQALESVMMNQRVHYFLDLGLSYFYRIKAVSWITAEYLQWTIYVKTNSRVYKYIKKLAKNFPGLLIPQVLLIILYKYICYPNKALAVKGYYKYRFFNVHQSLESPKVIKILVIMKIISFTIKQSGWLESKPESENYNWRM